MSRLFDLLRLHNLYPSKALGQVFLEDPLVMDSIVSILSPGPSDQLIEIGAGPGLITQKLASLAASLVAIEIDPKFRPLHEELFADLDRPPQMIYQDARKVNYQDLVRPCQGRLLVFGNLPYNLTTDLILTALAGLPQMSQALFMVQEDVRDRLTARPGSKAYGTLTVASNLFGNWRFERTVSRKAFYPQPRVTSALLSLLPSPKESDRALAADRQFHRFLTGLMQYRRKSLSNALKESGVWPGDETGRPLLDSFLKENDLPPGLRAEGLTPGQLARLYRLMT